MWWLGQPESPRVQVDYTVDDLRTLDVKFLQDLCGEAGNTNWVVVIVIVIDVVVLTFHFLSRSSEKWHKDNASPTPCCSLSHSHTPH